ncbi:hypothetical protein, partial [Paenibacillus thiaminolyticus]
KDHRAIRDHKEQLALKGLRVTKDHKAIRDHKEQLALKGLRATKDHRDLKGCSKAKLMYPRRNELDLQQISYANMNWLPRASLGSFFFNL